MEYSIRPITDDELPAFLRADGMAFGWVPSDADIELARGTFELDRSLAAFDGDEIVGTAGAFSFDMTLPGLTSTPVAGVSWVGVIPTHRRRGVLTSLMRRQLSDVRERGEAIAILLASESLIYGRFGYGLASTQAQLEIDRRHSAFLRRYNTPGRLTLVDRGAAAGLLPAVYERVRRMHPGAVSRRPSWWDGYFRDPESRRGGKSARFYVTYEPHNGQIDGYVAYRVENKWDEGGPSGILQVSDLMATTLEAQAALWRYCLDVDLIGTVQARNRPIDDPLRWMLADPRRLRFTSYGDFLWVRLLDIPAALSARRYLAPGHLVLGISDVFCPENNGRYALDGGPDGAECRLTPDDPDLVMDVTDLGAAYLGGVRMSTLARAGRVVEQRPGALRHADALFASETAPWGTTPF